MYEHDFCEYAVQKKKEGGYLVKILLCVLLALAMCAVIVFVILPKYGIPFGMIGIGLVILLLWFLSRYTAIEYEYTQTGSVVDFAAVYSAQYRKEFLSVDLKESGRSVAPYKNGRIEGGHKVQKVLDLRSSQSIQNAYAIVYEADGAVNAVLFDASKRMIENIRRQVPSITVLSDNLPEL